MRMRSGSAIAKSAGVRRFASVAARVASMNAASANSRRRRWSDADAVGA